MSYKAGSDGIVRIFFNNSEAVIPERSEWEKFENVDSLRLALFAAESWRRCGWQPEFFNTREYGLGQPPIEGRSREGFFPIWPFKRLTNFYPPELYNVWFEIARLGDGWYSTIDVFNGGFSPLMADLLLIEHHRDAECVVMQGATFSYACNYFTRKFAESVIDLVLRYERGEFDFPAGQGVPDMVSEEHLIRHFGGYQFAKRHKMLFMYAETGWKEAELLHLSRSCLQHPVREGIV